MVTWSFNCLNSGEDLFVSCGVKVCVILNPNLIFGSGSGAAVVVVAGAPLVVILGGDDVPFTGGELAFSRINNKISNKSIIKYNKRSCVN